jgi:hypothetical protein
MDDKVRKGSYAWKDPLDFLFMGECMLNALNPCAIEVDHET